MKTVCLFLLTINGGFMPQVNFMGQTHNFPDNFDNKMIQQALSSFSEASPTAQHISTPDASNAMRTERTNVSATQEYVGEGETFPELPSLNADQQQFIDTIGQIETGGLENRYIRTKVKPQPGGAGSSAYGPYQITHGLLSNTIDQSGELFDPVELRAAQELLERQEISLAIGGSDRKKYERGGNKHSMAQKWANDYGFESVDKFLDAFDYGGDFGLAKDGDFQTLYESFGRKMLLKQLKDANGDALEAASQWHGGANWKKGKHKGTTEQYRKKYERIVGR
jgi:hypothetical protein